LEIHADNSLLKIQRERERERERELARQIHWKPQRKEFPSNLQRRFSLETQRQEFSSRSPPRIIFRKIHEGRVSQQSREKRVSHEISGSTARDASGIEKKLVGPRVALPPFGRS
jgi:hypothetical protein